jgi:hypothetical protein
MIIIREQISTPSSNKLLRWIRTPESSKEKRLAHREEVEAFYRALAGQKVRVGMEASGRARWFERLVEYPLLSGVLSGVITYFTTSGTTK